MHRSPGFLIMTKEKLMQAVTVIQLQNNPGRGSWLDFEFDQKIFCILE